MLIRKFKQNITCFCCLDFSVSVRLWICSHLIDLKDAELGIFTVFNTKVSIFVFKTSEDEIWRLNYV